MRLEPAHRERLERAARFAGKTPRVTAALHKSPPHILAAGGAGLLVGSSMMSLWGGPHRRVRGYLGFEAAQGVALLLSSWSPHPLVIACGQGLFFLSFAGP